MPPLRPGISSLITDTVCEKLRNGKVKTVLDFIQADFQYLNKCAQLSYKEVLAIRKVLFAQYAIYPTPAADMLNEMLTNRAIFSTGCNKLDELLRGGIFTGELTEIIGPIAAGKTQFCFTILIQVALINKQTALYIDTNNAVTNSRIKEMAIKNGYSQQAIYEFQLLRVRFARVNNIFELFTILEQIRSDLTNRSNQFFLSLRLLIIDSINPLIASLLCGCHNDGNGLMIQIAHLIKTLSTDYSLAVIITNNSVSMENGTFKAALGAYWQHVPNTRFLMTNYEGSSKRKITLMKSTRAATEQSIIANLSAKGIEDS